LDRVDITAWTFWNAERPVVAADIPGFPAAYEGWGFTAAGNGHYASTPKRHVYGRVLWPYASYVPTILR
jgi:hypothetical protein